MFILVGWCLIFPTSAFFPRVHHVKLPTDKVSRINTNLKLFDAFFVCVLGFVLSVCFIVVDQLTQWMPIHHAIQRVYIAQSQTQTHSRENNNHHIEVPNEITTETTIIHTKKIYFLYFDVPFFFCHFFSFNFHRVISGSFQFEFLAGNLHEYNDFWAPTKRDNILKSRNAHTQTRAHRENERTRMNSSVNCSVCVQCSYHKPISLFHFFLSRKIWTHCQRNLFDWFRYLTTRFDCK